MHVWHVELTCNACTTASGFLILSMQCRCLGRDCCVPHGGKNVTGMALVGAVCDHCEAWVCHSRKCLTT